MTLILYGWVLYFQKSSAEISFKILEINAIFWKTGVILTSLIFPWTSKQRIALSSFGFFKGSVRLERTTRITKSNHSPCTPCPLTTSVSATPIHVLNTSRDGDSTTSLCSLCHCLTALSEKKWFLISNLKLACATLAKACYSYRQKIHLPCELSSLKVPVVSVKSKVLD